MRAGNSFPPRILEYECGLGEVQVKKSVCHGEKCMGGGGQSMIVWGVIDLNKGMDTMYSKMVEQVEKMTP